MRRIIQRQITTYQLVVVEVTWADGGDSEETTKEVVTLDIPNASEVQKPPARRKKQVFPKVKSKTHRKGTL